MARTPKTIAAAPLGGEIATTGNGRDITQTHVLALKQPRDRRLLRSVDWGAYDEIRKDDQVKSCMEQRIRAVVSAEWDVLPGDDQDPRSVEAAEALKANLENVAWDRVTEKKLWCTFYGYQVAELVWGPVDGRIGFTRIIVRHGRRFRYDKDGAFRLVTNAKPDGELLPDRKFWVTATGATNDDEPYGEGLADWLYWPTYFKRNGIRFWNIFLDKFGTPTAKATYRRGTPASDVAKIVQMLQALATDSGFAVPEGVAVELLQAAKSGTGDFATLCRYMDEAIAKLCLSQTMTTQDGSSMSQAKVHADVKLEVVKADADLLSDSFNNGPARWWTDINFGTDVAAPQVVRLVEEEADLKVMAETDGELDSLGWVRTEESFKDTYGDGYERKPEPKQPDPAKADPNAAPADGGAPKPGDAPKPGQKPEPVSFAATDPRPLYVYRKLKNAKEFLAWAKAQGFTSTLPAADLHVTIVYSRRAVDWFAMGGNWGPVNGEIIVPAGGARAVGKLGEDAVVLHFSSAEIEWRHEEMHEKGASWDFAKFHPHVTISYDGAPADLDAVEPYQGKLVFGPEIFEPLDEDWKGRISETSFAEGRADAIDQVVADILAEQGWAPLSPQLKAVIDAIEASGSPEELDASLLQALDTADAELLTQVLGRAAFGARIGAETGGGR